MSEVVTVDRNILRWLAGGERGLSSEAMAFVALGEEARRWHQLVHHPLDPPDLQRCLKLVLFAPAVRDAFPAIRALSPQWATVIDHWDELTASLQRECPLGRDGTAPKTYARMKDLGL